MNIDELWPGGPKFMQSDSALKLGTDSVLLSSFALKGRAASICDLGCGSGIISIILAAHLPEAKICGIEILPEAAVLAEKNAALNNFSHRINIINGDLRAHRTLLRAGDFDLTVANPPYFPYGSGRASSNPKLMAARDDRTCTLEDICTAAAYCTKWGGRFVMVHRTERLASCICAMSKAGLEPKRLRLVHNKAGDAPILLLIEGKRGGRPGLTIEPPLVLRTDSGEYSPEILKIYHRS